MPDRKPELLRPRCATTSNRCRARTAAEAALGVHLEQIVRGEYDENVERLAFHAREVYAI